MAVKVSINGSKSETMLVGNNKQLLDEAEHDIKNDPDLGQCAEAEGGGG